MVIAGGKRRDTFFVKSAQTEVTPDRTISLLRGGGRVVGTQLGVVSEINPR